MTYPGGCLTSPGNKEKQPINKEELVMEAFHFCKNEEGEIT